MTICPPRKRLATLGLGGNRGQIGFRGGSSVRRILLSMAFSLAGLALVAAATAGGPPVVNSTTHFINESFGGVGANCASGNRALSNGLFSGVIHTLARPDGSVLVSANTRGTDQLDDLPTDGTIDATTTFVFNSHDIVFATGKEVHNTSSSEWAL